MKTLLSASMLLSLGLLAAGCDRNQSTQSAIDGTAPVASSAPATPANAAPQLVNWGPQGTPAGTAFQVQADGGSGMFFEFDSELPAAPTAVTFNGTPLGGLVAEGKVVTGTVPAASLATPGTYEIVIVMPEGGPKFAPLAFTVADPAK